MFIFGRKSARNHAEMHFCWRSLSPNDGRTHGQMIKDSTVYPTIRPLTCTNFRSSDRTQPVLPA
jgi:hypothetical protein